MNLIERIENLERKVAELEQKIVYVPMITYPVIDTAAVPYPMTATWCSARNGGL